MMKKFLVVFIILSMLVSSGSVVFAAETADSVQLIADNQAEIVEAATGTSDINGAVHVTRKDFVVDGITLEVDIPKNGNQEIELEPTDGEPFSIGLPEEVEDSHGVMTDQGTIIYNGLDEVSVAVQSTLEVESGLIIEGVRSMVVIPDNNAPKSYSFDYNLPEGYRLVTSEEYYGTEDGESGWIYIVDSNNIFVDNETGEAFPDIIAAIEPAWAKDAEGKTVPTYYTIDGDLLTQYVDFHENCNFPITADPATTTKPKNTLLTSGTDVVKINNSDVSATVTLAGFGTKIAKEGFKKVFQQYAKQELKEKLAKQLAKRGVKYVSSLASVAVTAIDIYCAYQWLAKGYTYTNIRYKYEEWKIYKHQGGRWVAGYSHKAWPTEIWGSKS